MTYPSIRIEGQIFSGELLEKLDQSDTAGQKPADFGLSPDTKVKDEIARAWAASQSYYRAFKQKMASSEWRMASGNESSSHSLFTTHHSPRSLASETRNLWLIPFLSQLGYSPAFARRGVEVNGKLFPISHRDEARDGLPLHLLGWNDSLDRRRDDGSGPRMSPHALVQEYLNLTEHLYSIVSNGRTIRLLRDSTRLVRQSFIEFDLERMFEEDLFADFAVLFRLLHASRLPKDQATVATSLIEKYHQDALDQGARIRDGLSNAVEQTILGFANGFLRHPANNALREAIAARQLAPETYYNQLLRLIYRFLFLLVTEERRLIFPPGVPARKRDIYDRHYSLQRIRRLAEKAHLAERHHQDLWLALRTTFRLFEAGGPGHKIDIAPLAGDLFSPDAIGLLNQCALDNGTVLDCLRALSLYQHPDTRQLIRVNYAALNVEEFGSVYEGLLEYEPIFTGLPIPTTTSSASEVGLAVPASRDPEKGPASPLRPAAPITFAFKQGDTRAATGSHYTPDELVQPLIKHSLDYLIADKLKEPNPETALLSLRVADISCGSGHILLAAARRIATELAVVRTGEDQPSPTAFRAAVRDVIRTCIYGVDLNPLAVELCKVALWLEAHIPGQPLNFLDHHIKCGNAIVGYARREDVERGVPDEAFKTLPGDDKEVAAELRKRNKSQRRDHEKRQQALNFSPADEQLAHVLQRWREIAGLPEKTPDQIAAKKQRYEKFVATADAYLLRQILAIPIAQFYLPKTDPKKLITDADFRLHWTGQRPPQGQATAAAWAIAHQKRFFHWFLEFPEIFQSLENDPAKCSKDWKPGFDLILGNPPYLGGSHLSGTYGYPFCEYAKWKFAPTGLSDLVAFFVRRIYTLLRPDGFTAFITTNSIKDGDIRKDSLEQVFAQGGSINMAVRGIKWPGIANLVVSLLSIHKGHWKGNCYIDGYPVELINAFLDDSGVELAPCSLKDNIDRMYEGYKPLGDGFIVSHTEVESWINTDIRNKDVIFKLINGHELNSTPDQAPGSSIINFFDWDEAKASKYAIPFKVISEKVKPFRSSQNRPSNRDYWWIYGEHRPGLTKMLKGYKQCFYVARTTKYLNFSLVNTSILPTEALKVFTTDRWDLYAVVQSTIHEIWARKYSGALETRLRYSPSDCFETYPFPRGQWETPNPTLAAIGERYHEHRRALMKSLWLGLTDIYNLFHAPDLTPEKVAKVSKKPLDESRAGYEALQELRRLHIQLDTAVLTAYGWSDLPLGHDFVAVETLPENDRTRFTITPAARKDLLTRLLAENHKRAKEQATPSPKSEFTKKKARKETDDGNLMLIDI